MAPAENTLRSANRPARPPPVRTKHCKSAYGRSACSRSDRTEPRRRSGDRRRIALGEAALMPVGIGQRGRARCVQLRNLFRRQVPADGTEILAQLLLIARADDDVRDGWPLQQPVEGDLWHALTGFLGDP